MKVWEKVLEARLREIITINENQLGFSPAKTTIDGLFVLRQLQEKYGGMKKELHHIFVELENAFDKVSRRVIKWALRRQNVPKRNGSTNYVTICKHELKSENLYWNIKEI